MCLGIPGKVVGWIDRNPIFSQAEIEFEGVRKVCYMACVENAEVGDYVIVHAGMAICKIDAEAALLQLDTLQQLLNSTGESEDEISL
ncbi:MAG: HypC/HybG/HupF family hydrogenase formation chaperone [Planctomycetaceae bacterium]|nr:HypC/HybG/HupF family hydrogenase formation chaperone [Planctomycetaceae bacterium]